MLFSTIAFVGILIAIVVVWVRSWNDPQPGALSFGRAEPAPRSIELQPEHVEFLAQFTVSRTVAYLILSEENWESRLDEPLGKVLESFVRAGLLRFTKSKDQRLILTAKGAEIVAMHAKDARTRKAALRRL